MEIETKAVHSGYKPDPTTNAVAVPIYQTTAFAFDDTQHGADLFNLAVLGNILKVVDQFSVYRVLGIFGNKSCVG